jgi:hypothetical protein
MRHQNPSGPTLFQALGYIVKQPIILYFISYYVILHDHTLKINAENLDVHCIYWDLPSLNRHKRLTQYNHLPLVQLVLEDLVGQGDREDPVSRCQVLWCKTAKRRKISYKRESSNAIKYAVSYQH